MSDRLLTPRFLLMCGFSFTVFLSAFQLLPVAPFQILALGGDNFAAGLFVGLLTYASATSAPFTGALADRMGRRRTLVFCSLVIAVFAVGYALAQSYRVLLVLVFFHGLFWSGLLSAASAYATSLIPSSRRAEGFGYWGMSTVLAIALAPSLGLWIFRAGWGWVCLSVGTLAVVMALIAWAMEDDRPKGTPAGHERLDVRRIVEWRIVAVAITLFLCAFGHGGITSFVALYAASHGIVPRGLFFIIFAVVVVLSRPFSGRLADRIGARRVLIPCLVLTCAGHLMLATTEASRPWLVVSAVVYALGFGSAYGAFIADLLHYVDERRRGAAFGSVLAALDTGIGTGSISMGWVVDHYGYRLAFATAAFVALLAIPYYLVVAPRVLRIPQPTTPPVHT